MNTEFVKALAQFQGAVGNITRDASGMVGHRSYNYSTLGQIMSVIRAPLSESGLAVVQVFDDQRLTTRLLHADGEIVSSMTLNLQGLNPQQAGAVISYFRRYQLSSLLCLATEEDTDAADVGEPVNGKASKLASTFSMAPPPPMGLRQQLIASLAQEGEKAQTLRLSPQRERHHRAQGGDAGLRQGPGAGLRPGRTGGPSADLPRTAGGV
jgi:hypothetical protein